jgi:hypothetical protein
MNPAVQSSCFYGCGSGQNHWIENLPFGLELVSWGSFLPGLDQHLVPPSSILSSPPVRDGKTPKLRIEMSLDLLYILGDCQSPDPSQVRGEKWPPTEYFKGAQLDLSL